MQTTYIDNIAFIYIRNKRVLVALSIGKDKWYIPGGKRELGESDKEALIREVKEELNVDIDPKTIEHFGIFEAQAHGKPFGTMVRMACYTANFWGELAATREIAQLEFFQYNQRSSTAPVVQLIFDALREKALI